MRCPNCGYKYTKVITTHPAGYNTIERLRRCKKCGLRFKTTEAPSKRDESLTEYMNRIIYEMQRDNRSE